jgi:hypothetical protein
MSGLRYYGCLGLGCELTAGQAAADDSVQALVWQHVVVIDLGGFIGVELFCTMLCCAVLCCAACQCSILQSH